MSREKVGWEGCQILNIVRWRLNLRALVIHHYIKLSTEIPGLSTIQGRWEPRRHCQRRRRDRFGPRRRERDEPRRGCIFSDGPEPATPAPGSCGVRIAFRMLDRSRKTQRAWVNRVRMVPAGTIVMVSWCNSRASNPAGYMSMYPNKYPPQIKYAQARAPDTSPLCQGERIMRIGQRGQNTTTG